MASRYDDLSADKLRAEAERRKLPTSGTKPELVARLEQADAEQATEKKAKANPLLADDRTVAVDDALAFTAGVRELADELAERLTTEVTEPLTDMETTVDDPRSGALVAGSRRLRGHVDDVLRDLRALSAAAGAMGQDAVG